MAMDRTSGPSLVATRNSLSPEAPMEAVRPRKRLQKPCTKLPKQQSSQQRHQQQLPTRPRQVTFVDESTETRPATRGTLGGQASPSRPKPRLQPPDLSDSKWAAYLGKGKEGIVGSMDSVAVSRDSMSVLSPAFPEFAHLAPGNAQPRLSIDSCSTPPSTVSSESPRIRLRRSAKTPVSRIGQLESKSPRNSISSSEGRQKRQSAEEMAEEYQQLLDGPESSIPEIRSEQQPSPPHRHIDHRRSPTLPRYSPAGSEPSTTPPPAVDLARCSPTSDDGTLVSFEEETIYFKPLSFAAEPESPSPACCDFTVPPQRSITPAAPKSLGLQICLDLLTRELSCAIFNRPDRSGNGLSSLQVWVMIEAYERLRDHLRDSVSMPTEETQSVELMLDTWLQALYTIHDSLALEAQRGVDRVVLDDLESEELD
ncbi:hypothetical protein MAPG_11090 [Magnaporthiopsis poae ATCC 64411]|uniref:Mating-type switching protein swi10 n=1 Tax=Magnaporthiopsis poae (strain ATCC 64411 / 73-15) TaxID=644358 RepID=A0A0C4EEB9_MAGP6|nr:hypothetical protein MAPG_11090 [Magnaporthiopsis poae ATCC 64411]